MIFEWDDRKEALNIQKHGVDFWEAQTVFFDPLAKQFLDAHPNESRFILIGNSSRPRTLLIVFSEFFEGRIRIISARLPTKNERRIYEEGI